MKGFILVGCLFLVIMASDHHDDHVDPPGCMCLDCRVKRNQIIIPEGYKPDKAQFTVKEDWLKANPGKKVVQLIPQHLSGLNNINTPEGKAHLAEKAAQQARLKLQSKPSSDNLNPNSNNNSNNRMFIMIHPDALEYFGLNVPKPSQKVSADKPPEAPKKKIRCKKCGSYDCQ